MLVRARTRLVLAVGLLLLAPPSIGVAIEQARSAQGVGEGQIRSELAINGRTATLAYKPTQTSGDPNKVFTSAGARVPLGELQTSGSLRIGNLALGKDGQGPVAIATNTGITYHLYLGADNNTWQVYVRDSANVEVGRFALTRKAAAPATPILLAALVPEDRVIGRLIVRWGEYRGTADIEFTDRESRRTEGERSGAEMPNLRKNDDDVDVSVLSRNRFLTQRNESAFIAPTGWRVVTSFARTFDGNGRGRRAGVGLPVDGADFGTLLGTPVGSVVMLTRAAIPRLKTEVPLRFGRATLGLGNLVPGFAGSYGLWLKRTNSGWALVFTNEPDVWGSQHNPDADAAEIALEHSDGHAPSRPFAVGIEPTAADRGRIVIIWGPHEWDADFVAVG